MKFFKIAFIAFISVIWTASIFSFYIVQNPKRKYGIPITFVGKETLHFWGLDTSTNCVSILLSKNQRVFYYTGKFSDSQQKRLPEIKETSFDPGSGLHELLKEIDSFTVNRLEALEAEKVFIPDSIYKKKRAMIFGDYRSKDFLIKVDSGARYNEFVRVIDELKLLKLSKFVEVDISESEKNALKTATSPKLTL